VEASYIWVVVICMAAANYLTRFPATVLFSRVKIPEPIMRWLAFVPASVMGSLVALEIFKPKGDFIDPLSSPYVWAGLLTAAAYYVWRSFLGATLVGLVAFVALRSILG